MIAGCLDVAPVKKGDVVVIPAGTSVRAVGRENYVLTRKQTVTVHHTLPGIRQRIAYLCDKDRRRHPEFAKDFEAFDNLMLNARTHPDPSEADRLSHEAYEMYVDLELPSVRWPGSGGYWRGVAINDVVRAN